MFTKFKSLTCNFRPKIKFNNFIHTRAKTGLKLWDEELTISIKLDIEKHWSEEVLSAFRKNLNGNKFYIVPMFPYPSGNLHMGHVRVYAISDTIARCEHLSGKNVIHPMGWDSFGLPAENAAIQNKVAPEQWTLDNIKSMKSQLGRLGFNFDWSRELSTCDPSYYKWTQLIFLNLFERGLAYQNKAVVNWDPVDQTVLADEQVDDIGCSWRSGAKVEKKCLKQWFIRTTKFAEALYNGLDTLDKWKDIIDIQKHWIGSCDGFSVTFQLLPNPTPFPNSIDIWSLDPYKFLHAQFLTISPESLLAQEYLKNSNTTFPYVAYNPISGKEIPIYITDSINYPEGRDIYLCAPALSCEDAELANRLQIPIVELNITVNRNADSDKAIKIAQEKNVGGYKVSSKLKDWLISRQRFWGTPIPIIHCDNCGLVPVPINELPVKLPQSFSSEHKYQNLKEVTDWVNCKCPSCKSDAKRDTDTMDTFVDSSWYYYRFLDSENSLKPFQFDSNSDNSVDVYIGGKEHAVLHLYYARFMSYFLNSLNWVSNSEPFKKLIVQGMVMGKSYKLKSSGKYITESEVIKKGKKYVHKESNEPVIESWEKMSKSKFNGESPKRLLDEYGCDTTRLFMLADVAPATERHWSDATFPGVLNWQKRLWYTIRGLHKCRNQIFDNRPEALSEDDFKNYETKFCEARNHFTSTTTYHFKHTRMLSVGISRLQALTNVLRSNVPAQVIATSREYELTLGCLIIMLAPVAPHFCTELWDGFVSAPNKVNLKSPLIDWKNGLHDQSWPAVDEHFELPVQCKVDGADRCTLKIQKKELDAFNEQDVLQIMLKQEDVVRSLRNGIDRTHCIIFPGCRCTLNIFTKKQNMIKASN